MSRTFFRKPEFRLAFDYPQITLTRAGTDAPQQVFDLGSATLLAELRRLGGEIRAAGGRLTVVLPEGEVWRGRLPLGGAKPRDRRQVARTRAAEAMGLPAKALAIRFGRLGRDGALPAAAVRRDTLVETRGFLSRAGLRPTRITGAGAFDGFAAAPRLDAALPDGLRPALPAAGGAIAAAVLLAFLLRPDATPLVTDIVGPVPLAEAVEPLAQVTPPVIAELAPRRRPADLVRVAALPEPVEALAPAALPQPVASAGLQLGAPVSMGSRNLPVTELPPPPVADTTLRLASLTFARARLADTVTALPLLPRPAAAVAPAAKPVEVVRETPPAATPPVVAAPTAVAAPAISSPRPLRRPAAPEPAATPAAAPATSTPEPVAAAAPAIAPPLARPQDEIVAEVSRAIATAVVTAGVQSARQSASAASESLSSAALLTAGRPEPRRATAPVRQAAATPQRAAPAPTPQRATPTPQRTAAAQPARQTPPRAAAAPQRTAAAQPTRQVAQPTRQAAQPTRQAAQPTRQAAQPTRQAAQPARQAAQPARQAAQPAPTTRQTTQRAAAPQRAQTGTTSAATAAAATETVGFSRRGMALIGVFGADRDRYAMVRLPNGTMQRVKAGDRVQGASVAAIGADSVHLANGRRTTVLTMPN